MDGPAQLINGRGVGLQRDEIFGVADLVEDQRVGAGHVAFAAVGEDRLREFFLGNLPLRQGRNLFLLAGLQGVEDPFLDGDEMGFLQIQPADVLGESKSSAAMSSESLIGFMHC